MQRNILAFSKANKIIRVSSRSHRMQFLFVKLTPNPQWLLSLFERPFFLLVFFLVICNDDSMVPSFPRNIFVKLMQLATSSVAFSFNNNMHRQIDGVAMGSPLGPALSNIFVGYQEAKLFNIAKRPLAYFRYVDDIFAVFNNEEDCNTFFSHPPQLSSYLITLHLRKGI